MIVNVVVSGYSFLKMKRVLTEGVVRDKLVLRIKDELISIIDTP